MQVARTLSMETSNDLSLARKITEAHRILAVLGEQIQECDMDKLADLYIAVSITTIPKDTTTKEL